MACIHGHTTHSHISSSAAVCLRGGVHKQVELCVYRNVSVWIEANGDRVVGVSADIRNVGRGYVCNLDIAVDNLEHAVSVWPAWFPTKTDAFAPGRSLQRLVSVRT